MKIHIYCKLVLLISLILLMPCVSHANDETFSRANWDKAYSVRQFKLGMTLDAFKTTHFPDTQNNGKDYDLPVKTACSNMLSNENSYQFPYLNMDYGDDGIGVIKCQHYYIKNDSPVLSQLLLTPELAISPVYYFIKPHGENEYLLFKIKISTENYNLKAFSNAYHQKYGKPAVSREAVVNGFGVPYTNYTWTWENGVSRLRVIDYDFDLDTMSTTYSLKPLMHLYETRRRINARMKSKML
jgi:hypothetical protein